MAIQWSRLGLSQLVALLATTGDLICRKLAAHWPTPGGHRSNWLIRNKWSSNVATRNSTATYRYTYKVKYMNLTLWSVTHDTTFSCMEAGLYKCK